MPKIAESSRIASIDALRAIAALTVLLFHFESFALTPVGQFGAFIPAESQNFHLALMGVELFFVISGFVISWTIERTGSAKKFFLNRAARLYPAYWVSLAFSALVVGALAGFNRDLVFRTIVDFTMIQRFLFVKDVISPYWTLAFELWFYVIAAIVFTRFRKNIEIVCLVWLSIITICKLMHAFSSIEIARPPTLILMTQFGQFFIIGITMYRMRFYGINLSRWACLICAIGLSAFGREDWANVKPLDYFLMTLLISGFMWLAALNTLPLAQSKLVRELGESSYSLYLLHVPVGLLLWKFAGRFGLPMNPILFGAGIPLSIFLASVCRRTVEVPGQQAVKHLANRFNYNQKTQYLT